MSQATSKSDPPKHLGFATRFQLACEQHGTIPDMGSGRLKWIRDRLSSHHKLDVSLQTLSMWYSGDFFPRQAKLEALAEVLKVTPTWLAYGDARVKSEDDRKARANAKNGAINLVAGLFQMGGGTCAFPDDGDPQKGSVHFYLIAGGKQHRVRVVVGEPVAKKIVIPIPADYSNSTIVCVVPGSTLNADIYHLPTQLIDRAAEKSGGDVTLQTTRDGSSLKTGKTVIPKMESLEGTL